MVVPPNLIILNTRDQVILQLLAMHDQKDAQISQLQQRVAELEKAMSDTLRVDPNVKD